MKLIFWLLVLFVYTFPDTNIEQEVSLVKENFYRKTCCRYIGGGRREYFPRELKKLIKWEYIPIEDDPYNVWYRISWVWDWDAFDKYGNPWSDRPEIYISYNYKHRRTITQTALFKFKRRWLGYKILYNVDPVVEWISECHQLSLADLSKYDGYICGEF